MNQNKPELFLEHYYKKLNALNIEIKFMTDNKENFLSNEIFEIILEEKEEQRKLYVKKIQQYENYRQTLTGAEKNVNNQ